MANTSFQVLQVSFLFCRASLARHAPRWKRGYPTHKMADSANFPSPETMALTAIVAASILLVVALLKFISGKSNTGQSLADKEIAKDEKLKNGDRVKGPAKSAKQGKPRKGGPAQTHHRQAAVLKGHTSNVCDLDFSVNGKYMASASEGLCEFNLHIYIPSWYTLTPRAFYSILCGSPWNLRFTSLK